MVGEVEMEELIELLERERNKLYREADDLCDAFWDEHYKRVENGGKGFHGVRTRKRRAGVTIEWFRMDFSRLKDGKKSFYRTINRGKAYKYTPQKFASMEPWERDLALAIEEHMGPIRRQSETLVSMRKMILAYMKADASRSERLATCRDKGFIARAVDHSPQGRKDYWR